MLIRFYSVLLGSGVSEQAKLEKFKSIRLKPASLKVNFFKKGRSMLFIKFIIRGIFDHLLKAKITQPLFTLEKNKIKWLVFCVKD